MLNIRMKRNINILLKNMKKMILKSENSEGFD